MLPAAEDSAVASQFLVGQEAAARGAGQRMEPKQAADQRGQRVPPKVATARMQRFVGQYRSLFGGVVTQKEVGGEHDARPQQPDQHWAGIRPHAQPGALPAGAQRPERKQEGALAQQQQAAGAAAA